MKRVLISGNPPKESQPTSQSEDTNTKEFFRRKFLAAAGQLFFTRRLRNSIRKTENKMDKLPKVMNVVSTEDEQDEFQDACENFSCTESPKVSESAFSHGDSNDKCKRISGLSGMKREKPGEHSTVHQQDGFTKIYQKSIPKENPHKGSSLGALMRIPISRVLAGGSVNEPKRNLLSNTQPKKEPSDPINFPKIQKSSGEATENRLSNAARSITAKAMLALIRKPKTLKDEVFRMRTVNWEDHMDKLWERYYDASHREDTFYCAATDLSSSSFYESEADNCPRFCFQYGRLTRFFGKKPFGKVSKAIKRFGFQLLTSPLRGHSLP